MDESTKLLSDTLSLLCFLDENSYVSGEIRQECLELILRLRSALNMAEVRPKETPMGTEMWNMKPPVEET